MSQTKAQLIDPVDGTIVNADINASAAIAGSKISPSFTSSIGVTTNNPNIRFDDSDTNNNGEITLDNTQLRIEVDEDNAVGSSAIKFRVDGSDKAVIDSSGNVGIGTTSPASFLHIESSSSPTLRIDDSDTSGALLLQQDGANGSALLSSAGTFSIGVSNDNSAATLTFLTRNSERMRIDSSGRLLLGTTTEGVANASKFTIATSAHCGVTIRSGAAHDGQVAFSDGTSGDDEFRGQIRYNHTSNFLAIATDAVERMRIDSSGKIGIGTTSPTKELDVVGEIKASGSVFTTGINAGQVGGNRNLLINGAMDIWQRGTSTSTSGEYQADRFWMSNAATYARDTSVPSDNFVYSAKLTYGSSDMAFGQPVELKAAGEASPFLPGGKCTLSFYAKTASGTEAAAVTINFRSSKFVSTNQAVFNAASGDNSDLNFTATTSWQRFTFTFTVPTPHSSSVLAGLEIYGMSSTMFITGVQLELGEIATEFEFRELATELTLCQRYAYVVDARGSIDNFAPIGTGRFYNGTDAQIFIPLPTTMRHPPSFDANHTTSSNTFFLNVNGGFAGHACTQLSLNERSFNAVTMVAQSIGNISGQTVGIATTLYCDDADDARLMLTAEF